MIKLTDCSCLPPDDHHVRVVSLEQIETWDSEYLPFSGKESQDGGIGQF